MFIEQLQLMHVAPSHKVLAQYSASVKQDKGTSIHGQDSLISKRAVRNRRCSHFGIHALDVGRIFGLNHPATDEPAKRKIEPRNRSCGAVAFS